MNLSWLGFLGFKHVVSSEKCFVEFNKLQSLSIVLEGPNRFRDCLLNGLHERDTGLKNIQYEAS